MAATSGDLNAFVVAGDYGQTVQDNRFFGAMGILGILAYGFGFLGAPAFMQFALYAFRSGSPQSRDGAYYRGRLAFYSFVLFVAGLSQCLLGFYVLGRYGNELTEGPVSVAFYIVNVPGISIFVGLVQIINAVWGFLRSRQMMIMTSNVKDDDSFQVSMALGWFLQLVLQVIVQPASLPGGVAALNAPTVAAFALGQNVMPAFLDYKARTMPESIDHAYYYLTDKKLDTNNYDTSTDGAAEENQSIQV